VRDNIHVECFSVESNVVPGFVVLLFAGVASVVVPTMVLRECEKAVMRDKLLSKDIRFDEDRYCSDDDFQTDGTELTESEIAYSPVNTKGQPDWCTNICAQAHRSNSVPGTSTVPFDDGSVEEINARNTNPRPFSALGPNPDVFSLQNRQQPASPRRAPSSPTPMLDVSGLSAMSIQPSPMSGLSQSTPMDASPLTTHRQFIFTKDPNASGLSSR
jgi:hypothetical protein